MIAKEIMHKRVISVSPKMPLTVVAELFAAHGISGAPVLSDDGGLVGMISKTDLVSQPRQPPASPRRRAPAELRVEQAMTPWCVTLEEDAPVLEVARQMAAKQIHRVVITHEGAISGIVTSLDVVRALLTLLEKAP